MPFTSFDIKLRVIICAFLNFYFNYINEVIYMMVRLCFHSQSSLPMESERQGKVVQLSAHHMRLWRTQPSENKTRAKLSALNVKTIEINTLYILPRREVIRRHYMPLCRRWSHYYYFSDRTSQECLDCFPRHSFE